MGEVTILLVEDDDLVREVVAKMLGRLDFTVIPARDGVEAIEIFQQNRAKIDCVVSDLTMPRMAGWATMDALRQLSPNLPIILSSGYDEGQIMSTRQAQRPEAFLSKPYQLQRLHQVIRQVLAARKSSG
jgi:CheY-like chemotaxis protein